VPETVALKVLSPESRKKMEERYEIWLQRSMSKSTEEDIATRLNHPNVIQTYEFGEEGGKIYIVMEYFDGNSLRDEYVKFREDKRFDSEIFEAIFQASKGLDHLCRKGIVHRDISPKNMLVKPEMLRADQPGAVKIIDFGLAMTTGELRAIKYTDKVGTVGYRAPEQFAKRSIDQRVDVYAFGATMYELASGRQPFKGRTRQERRFHQQHPDSIPNVRKIEPQVPEDLDELIMKCLTQNKDDRPPDMSFVHTNLVGMRYRLDID
jgi:serine/threonine-protein kinase